MTLKEFNKQSHVQLKQQLTNCCGSKKWVNSMLEIFPFESISQLLFNAKKIWFQDCSEGDILEAFNHHPMIGDLDNLKSKFASTATMSSSEQSGVSMADEETIVALFNFNKDYLEKFGFIFLICATGKPADAMLEMGLSRLNNERDVELRLASKEHFKITLIRLGKYINEIESFMKKSQITTHVLDTALGIPGRDILISLNQKKGNAWEQVAVGRTDEDGRVSDLLPSDVLLEPGIYKLIFDSGSYFAKRNQDTFFPEVSVQFKIKDDPHYHVPLLISPYTYSTYRGS